MQSPCLCQASLIENNTLLTEAGLSLRSPITVLQENNTTHLNLHLIKNIFAREDSSHPEYIIRKISLKYFSFNFTGLIKISQYFNIAYCLKSDLLAPPRTFWHFLLRLFPPLFTLPHRFYFSCPEFCILLPFVCLLSPWECCFVLLP